MKQHQITKMLIVFLQTEVESKEIKNKRLDLVQIEQCCTFMMISSSLPTITEFNITFVSLDKHDNNLF
jgi:hypothetical protein